MEKINILFGFEESQFQRSVEKRLGDFGYDAEIVCKYSKKAIADYFHNHTEVKHVVLKEMISRNSYHDQELRRGIDLQENNRGRIIWTDQSEFSVAVWAEESLV